MRPSLVIMFAALALAGCTTPDTGVMRAGKPAYDAPPHHGPGTPVTRRGGR